VVVSQQTIYYTFFYGNGNADYHLGAGFFIHKRNKPAIRREEFSSDRISYNTKRPVG
jgi:hypothetical protein